MPVMLQTCQANLLDDLDDENGLVYPSSSTQRWINDACSDIAKRAECLWTTVNINTVGGQAVTVLEVAKPIIRVHRITWTFDGVQIYPLEFRTVNDMDSVWGIWQTQPSAWPAYCSFWESPPVLTVQLFPVPSPSGTMSVWYYRNSTPCVNPPDYLDIPEGWEPTARQYAKYMALRRTADPRWQEERELYEAGLESLIAATRQYHDQASGQVTSGGAGMPWWMFGGDQY
jgi:hypothetical protein